MTTLPPGRVILCGHSMGGILAAEIAFVAPPARVIGLIAFDSPFLGIHPHVILSGIASLFKAKEGKDEAELNDPQHVEMVSKHAGRPGVNSSNTSTPNLNPAGPSNTVTFVPNHGRTSPSPASTPPALNTTSSALPPSLHLSSPRPVVRVRSPQLEQAFATLGLGPVPESVYNVIHFFNKHPGIQGIKDWVYQLLEFSGCLLDPQGLMERYEKLERWGSDETAGPYGRGWVNLWTITVPKQREDTAGWRSPSPRPEEREQDLANAMHLSYMMAQSNQGYTQSPKSTISTGDGSSIQSSLFHTRTTSTSTTPSDTTESSRRSGDLKAALEGLHTQMSTASISREEKTALKGKEKELKSEQKALEKEEKTLRKEAERQAKKEAKERQRALDAAAKRAREADKTGKPRHFIVLPRKGNDQRWICVPIAGADSEVSAHTSIFFKQENLEYDRMVVDVGNLVRSFWDGDGGLRHSKSIA